MHWDGLKKVVKMRYTLANANQEEHLTGYSTKMIVLLTLPPSLLGWLIIVDTSQKTCLVCGVWSTAVEVFLS